MSSHKGNSSSSNPVSTRSSRFGFSEGKDEEASVKASEVKKLKKRVRNLEKEGVILKQVFLESMEEWKNLMHEIYHKFEVIGCCSSYLNHEEGTRNGVGLSQVLCQESSPSLVIKDLRAKEAAFLHSTQLLDKYVNR